MLIKHFVSKAKHYFVVTFFFLIFFSIPSITHADLRNGLVGWWKFDESSGNAVDSSSGGNTGTPTGTTIVSNCKRGNCRYFNGNTDQVSVGTSASLAPANISVSLWVSSYATPADYDTMIGKAVDTTWQIGAWGVYYESGSLKFWIQDYANNVATKAFTVTQSWQHIVGTWDGATIKIYINGSIGTNDSYSSSMSTGGDLRIGNILGTAARGWPGYIDDVRVYNRVLTSQEISDLSKLGIVLRNGVLRNAVFNKK